MELPFSITDKVVNSIFVLYKFDNFMFVCWVSGTVLTIRSKCKQFNIEILLINFLKTIYILWYQWRNMAKPADSIVEIKEKCDN